MEPLDFDLDEAFIDDPSTSVDFSPMYDNVEISSSDEERWQENFMTSASFSPASECVLPHVKGSTLPASRDDDASAVALSSSLSPPTLVSSEFDASAHSSLGVVWSASSSQQCNPDVSEFVQRCVVLVSQSAVLGFVGNLLPDAAKELSLFREFCEYLGSLLFGGFGPEFYVALTDNHVMMSHSDSRQTGKPSLNLRTGNNLM